jgi:DNA-binding transcriptional regulator YhcF (GntR family)
MDIILNRRGGIPLRDQLVIQLELKLLAGALGPGQKLPSVRALARRLKLHPNTVSAAYQELEAAGHVLLKRGAGVFVRPGGPARLDEAQGLDEMIRVALHAAFQKGYSGAEIRAAVERWLAAAPPDRIVVVDPVREMGELLLHELRQGLPVRASACTIEELSADPTLLSGALALSLPYHVETIRQLVPGCAQEVLTLEVSDQDRAAILKLPPGSIVLVVSHAQTVLPFATVLMRSLRGDELHVETHLLEATRGWRRLVPAADLVFADALSVAAVRKGRPRRLQEVRFASPLVLGRLQDALAVVVPRDVGGARRPARKEGP